MAKAALRLCTFCGNFVRGECPCRRAAALAARRNHPTRQAAKNLYASGAWRRARVFFLLAHPQCPCGQVTTVVDHEPPHRNDYVKFWDRRTWRAVCKRCHDRKTASHDGGFGNPRRT